MNSLKLILLGFFLFNRFAYGGITIEPSRIIFDMEKRQEIIQITNTGNDSTFFSLSFIQYYMNEMGGLELIKSNNKNNFAHTFIRMYPRQLILAPAETKTIRLQLMSERLTDEKEFRSHLFFEAIDNSLIKELDTHISNDNMRLEITTLFNFSIPVIIRNTKEEPICNISEVQINLQENPHISFHIYRSGKVSTYGNIFVDFMKSNGDSVRLAQSLGVAIYTCLEKRFFKLPLQWHNSLDLSDGILRVSYINDENNSNKVYTVKNIKI